MEPMPPRDSCVMRYVIEHNAEVHPEKLCVDAGPGQTWTYQQGREAMYRAANALRCSGIDRGDRVAVMLPNGLAWMRAWWGITALGATIVPVNPALRGEILQHVLTDSGAKLVVISEELLPRVQESGATIQVMHPDALVGPDDTEPSLEPPIELWETAWINYTSGTTGPSKGVITSHLHAWRMAFIEEFGTKPDDTVLILVPLFHIAGSAFASSGWYVGANVAIRSHFRAEAFLDDVRETGGTITILMASMTTALCATAPRPDDADTTLRTVDAVPLPPDADGFKRRFGLDELITVYGMTETGGSITACWRDGVGKPTSSGKPRKGIDVRIVDANDMPVPVGEKGELVIRPDRPWEITSGYHNRPEATAALWRNGWLHTGDTFWQDDEGYYYFVDRRTDSLRRRGENISSFEVERAVMHHPDVAEVGCIGVRDERNDQDVMIYVVPVQGRQVNPPDLIDFMVPKLPYFALPRYVEIIDELPKTPTARVQKYLLRDRGVTERTWDREAAGVVYKRDY